MSRSWQYPRWRRILMQATLWVVLFATVGLAALVDHYRSAESALKLGPMEAFGPVSLRLPSGWAITAEGEPVLLVQAEEGSDGRARILSVLRQPVRDEMTPLEFIIRSGLAPPAAARVAHPIAMAGQTGTMVSVARQVRGPGGVVVAERELVAVAMVRPSHAIILHLSSAGNSLGEDEELMRDVATTMKINEQAESPDGSQL
ncbi:MAG: hypothetical protein IT446_15855 [Phycisphaerales bacterium]|nr:hypothetical protein [Phycisphaerales bacterium]